MHRDYSDRAHRAAARQLLSGQSTMQEPRSGVNTAELISRSIVQNQALGQHGPEEDPVTDTSPVALGDLPYATTEKEPRKYRLRVVVIALIVGLIAGGPAGAGIMYYRDWWFSGELMSTRAFLLPVAIVVGVVVFLVFIKLPLTLIRRSRNEKRQLRQQLAAMAFRLEELTGPTVVPLDPPPASSDTVDGWSIPPSTAAAPPPARSSGRLRGSSASSPKTTPATAPTTPPRRVTDLAGDDDADDDLEPEPWVSAGSPG